MKIVLAHGILGFGTIDLIGHPVSYFKGVKQELERHHHQVIAPPVSPTGPITKRAPVLAQAIKDFATPTDKACIIAHSMGGLDARFAIVHDDDVAARVHTLVTIGTPHFGSPIADKFSVASELHKLLNVDSRLLTELESTTFLHDLTTGAGAAAEDRKGITYHAIAGVGRHVGELFSFHTCALFFPTFAIMAAHGLANDGMVPKDSAAGGEKLWEVWPCDHADEIGWDLDHPETGPSPEHLQRYVSIVQRLPQ